MEFSEFQLSPPASLSSLMLDRNPLNIFPLLDPFSFISYWFFGMAIGAAQWPAKFKTPISQAFRINFQRNRCNKTQWPDGDDNNDNNKSGNTMPEPKLSGSQTGPRTCKPKTVEGITWAFVFGASDWIPTVSPTTLHYQTISYSTKLLYQSFSVRECNY